jgi:hypothetical protein
MQPVFQEFLRQDRETGTFLHPAKMRTDFQSEEDAQLSAIRQVLQVAVTAASDYMSVSKVEEIDAAKERLKDDASRLREIAHDSRDRTSLR